MKAIILAAGKSTRTWPLTENMPKPLLPIVNKTLLEHNLDKLEGKVTDVLLIVGFMADAIKEHIGTSYGSLTIHYTEQKEQKGTGHALYCAKNFIAEGDEFLLLPGDDLFGQKDIDLISSASRGVLAQRVETPELYGIFSVDENNNLLSLVEKPKKFIGDLANTGCYKLCSDIFPLLEGLKESERGEIEIIPAIEAYAKARDEFKVIPITEYWLPVGFPWHYLEANVFLLKTMKPYTKGTVEEGVTIKGNVIIEEGALVKSGTYIEGPVYIGKDAIIGPHAHIRPDSIIMDGVKTKAEIYDAVLMKDSVSKHNCYLGHSVIGERCNIAAGVVTTDYRHDGKNHITHIKGKKVDSKRRKLGVFLGSDVKTGAGTIFYPGRKLGVGETTLPGEVVRKDKPEQ